MSIFQIRKQRLKESKQSDHSHIGGYSQTRKADSGPSNAYVQAFWTVSSSLSPRWVFFSLWRTSSQRKTWTLETQGSVVQTLEPLYFYFLLSLESYSMGVALSFALEFKFGRPMTFVLNISWPTPMSLWSSCSWGIQSSPPSWLDSSTACGQKRGRASSLLHFSFLTH